MYIVAKVTPLVSFQKLWEDYLLCEDFLCSIRYLCKITEYCEATCEDQSRSHCFVGRNAECDFVFVNFIPSTGKDTVVSLKEYGTTHTGLSNICQCLQDVQSEKICCRNLRISMDGQLFSSVMSELQRSRVFRQRVLMNICALYKRKYKCKDSSIQNYMCPLCGNELWKIHVFVSLISPKQWILDSVWNRKIQILVNERCELENAMAWLSTLGGAFSALGDTYIHCAEKAGVISVRQLQIAMKMGDPFTYCRCKIYMAMSLLQRGYYKQTKKLIRNSYKFAISSEGQKDFRLRNMCIAVWNRLKYVLSLQGSNIEHC